MRSPNPQKKIESPFRDPAKSFSPPPLQSESERASRTLKMASWASTPNPLSLLKPNHPLKLHALFFPLNALQRRRGGGSVGGGALSSRAYMENPNSLSSFVGRVIGSLPVVGLLSRVLSDEGGVGGDIIDFAEFRRRVGKKCGVTDSRAFYEFRERRGRAGDSLYVLMCCWLAAVGAGLLKSEEILEGVARLRISDDIEFEEENFLSLMNDTKERRAKLKSANPEIPMEIRAAKALEAIHVCCFGKGPIEDEDVKLLRVILNAVFPSVGQSKIDEMVDTKAKQVAEEERTGAPEEEKKPLSKEAVDLQLKDLQFLKQNSENLKA